jgi:tripartite-type tricarboxylate transporter receptor subunit TctC
MRVAAYGIAVLLACSAIEAAAQQKTISQAFPVRPVRLIVANAAGSAPDIVARMVGAKLGEWWGQQVVVDNRPGATGLIAADALAKAAPDGSTLFLPTATHLISTLQAHRNLLARDFAAVALVATTPFVVVVDAALPVKTFPEWIAYARARPGQLLYGSDGQWGSNHLCMDAVNTRAGLQLDHVPYKSSALVLQDLAGGRIHAYCPAAPLLPSILQLGKMRALAITYQKPTPLAPGVPPVSDTLPGFEMLGWYGLLAPLRTPPHLVSQINGAVVKVLRDPPLQEQMIRVGAEAGGSTPAEFATFLRNETQRWEKVLREGTTIPKG